MTYQGYSNSATWAFGLAVDNEREEAAHVERMAQRAKTEAEFYLEFTRYYTPTLARKLATKQFSGLEGPIDRLEIAKECWQSHNE